MDNHYHLLVETPDSNLSLGMRQLNGMYTQYYNRSHKKVGHVFQGRFKSILVDRESYLLELCRYIVCNPVKAGLCKRPEDWTWSSYNSTVSEKNIPDCLTVDWVLGQFSKHKKRARKAYREFIDEGLADKSSPWRKVVGQLILGSEGFIEEMQAYLEKGVSVKEIPRVQRVAGRPPLEELFHKPLVRNKGERNTLICKAHLEYCYTLKDIAECLGIHYTTVSRVVSKRMQR
jgi:hypothetical protein